MSDERIQYEHSPAEVVALCNEIREDYQGQKLTLTLRQMYYRLVALGLSPNGQKPYKRLGAILTAARYDGSFPADGLEDRGRSLTVAKFERDEVDLDRALEDAARTIRYLPWYHLGRDRWRGQAVHVSVWVEKEALAGVFATVCDDLGVSWMACKGYPSVSAMVAWLDELSAAEAAGATESVVLYFGDHDPDGLEIPRSTMRGIERLRELREAEGRGIDIPISLERVALTMDQIQRYDPPPFPAKVSSARYAGYVAETGTEDAWELDALEPATLRELISSRVAPYFDESIHDRNNRRVDSLRGDMRRTLQEPGWISRIWEVER